jgi:ribulose kinase
VHGRGFFGTYTDAVVPGQRTIEGGQVSTGSVLNWFRENFCLDVVAEADRQGISAYDLLNEAARDVPLGSDGLIVLDYWQGNRTPYTDPSARGMIVGLSLHHSRAHLYRAIQEGICYGVAHILRAMSAGGFEATRFVACGGATKSRRWMQTHADVVGLPIALTETPDAASLGSAVLAAVGAELYRDIPEAAGAMVHFKEDIEPDMERHEQYRLVVDTYAATFPRVADLVHGLVDRTDRTSLASNPLAPENEIVTTPNVVPVEKEPHL